MTHPTIRRALVVAAVMAAFLLAAAPASASENQIFSRLGPHTFVPNGFVREPFIQSYFRNALGIGSTQPVFVPTVTLPDSTTVLGFETSVTVAALQFEWQYAMKSWVAFRARFEVFGRLGDSSSSLLSEGITGIGTYELGWFFKLLEGERDMLSLDLYMQRSQGAFVNLMDWLTQIIEDGGLEPDNSLVRNRDSLRGIAGLSYAHAFGSLFGVGANMRAGYGEQIDRNGKNDFIYSTRLGFSFNLNDTTRIPLGVFLGLQLSNWTNTGENLAGDLAGGSIRIDYLGFDDFILGLDHSYIITPVRGIEEDVKASTTLITLRYFY